MQKLGRNETGIMFREFLYLKRQDSRRSRRSAAQNIQKNTIDRRKDRGNEAIGRDKLGW